MKLFFAFDLFILCELGKLYSVQLGRLEHGSERDIGLVDGRPCIFGVHAVQNFNAVHGLHIFELHSTDNRLDILGLPLGVISSGIGRQVLDKLCMPERKPLVNGCILSVYAVPELVLMPHLV